MRSDRLCVPRFRAAACLLSLSIACSLNSCGDPPSAAPSPRLGHLRITALDTARIDSIVIALDDIAAGCWRNPCVLSNLSAGTHKVHVADREGPSSSSSLVLIREDAITDLVVSLLGELPYLGNLAPDFSVTSIYGDTLTLAAMRGRVVLLAFFEHT